MGQLLSGHLKLIATSTYYLLLTLIQCPRDFLFPLPGYRSSQESYKRIKLFLASMHKFYPHILYYGLYKSTNLYGLLGLDG